MMIRNVLTGLVLALALSGCMGMSQSVGPGGVEQSAGPFHQSVGPGGVEQSAGPYGPSQSVDSGGVRQSSGGRGTSCQVECRGHSYSAGCPAGEKPVCQCNSAPYASCAAPAARH